MRWIERERRGVDARYSFLKMGSRDEVRAAGTCSVRSVMRLIDSAVVIRKKVQDSGVKNVKLGWGDEW